MDLLVDLENIQPAADAVKAWLGAKGRAWIFHGAHQHRLLPAFRALGDRVTLVPISSPGANSLDFHLVFYLGYLAAQNPKCEFVVLTKDRGYDPAIKHAQMLDFRVKRITRLSQQSNAKTKATTRKPSKKVTVVPPAPVCKPVASRNVPSIAVRPKVASSTATSAPADKRAEAWKPPAQKKSAPAKVVSTPKRASAKSVVSIYRDVLSDVRGANRPRNLEALKRRIQSRFGPAPEPEAVQAILDHLEAIDAVRAVDNGRLVYDTSALAA